MLETLIWIEGWMIIQQVLSFQKRAKEGKIFFFDCIIDLGFKDCIAETYTDYVQTHRHNLSKFPWQIDHFFVSEKLFKSLTNLEVIENEEILKLSDHNPIVAEFKHE